MTNEQYYDLIKPYEDARRVMNTRLEVLNHSLYKEKNVSGPIHNIQGRLKEKRSIEDKLRRLGFTDSIVNARNELQDIAGIRVICYFVNDIYNMVNILKRQTDLVVIKEKDYIQSPKPNGYRSLHLVLGIPVYCLDTMEYFPVEVQFRTWPWTSGPVWSTGCAIKNSRRTGNGWKRNSAVTRIYWKRLKMNLKYTMKGNDLAWDSWNQPSIRHIDRHPGKLSPDAVFLRLLYIIIVR